MRLSVGTNLLRPRHSYSRPVHRLHYTMFSTRSVAAQAEVNVRRTEGGQSLLEFALILPLLLFALVGAADLARAFAVQLAVQNAARAGAESYAVNFTPTFAAAIARADDELSRTPGIDATQATVTMSTAQVDGLTACVAPPTVATPCYVTSRVQYTFHTIVAWPLVPNVANFDRSTLVRTFQ